jgi:putative transposase
LARQGTRFEALEPIRQGVRTHVGAFGQDVARGLTLRHDHGSQYMSRVFQDELRFLGLISSPAFVREPQGHGCAERFIRTLKENLLRKTCCGSPPLIPWKSFGGHSWSFSDAIMRRG